MMVSKTYRCRFFCPGAPRRVGLSSQPPLPTWEQVTQRFKIPRIQMSRIVIVLVCVLYYTQLMKLPK